MLQYLLLTTTGGNCVNTCIHTHICPACSGSEPIQCTKTTFGSRTSHCCTAHCEWRLEPTGQTLGTVGNHSWQHHAKEATKDEWILQGSAGRVAMPVSRCRLWKWAYLLCRSGYADLCCGWKTTVQRSCWFSKDRVSRPITMYNMHDFPFVTASQFWSVFSVLGRVGSPHSTNDDFNYG